MNGNDHRNGNLRDDLIRQADDVRTKLVTTFEQIDQRRHDVFNVPKQIERHLKTAAIVAGLVIAATAAAATFATYRLLTAGSRRRHPRWQGWRKGERVERGSAVAHTRAPRRSFVREAVRSLALTFVTTLLGAPVRRAAGGRR
jgi:hypothetical protein